MPWYSGYAEAINAGKSARNEDQAAFHRGVLRTKDLSLDDGLPIPGASRGAGETHDGHHFEIPYIYFGIFDGHAGSATAVTAANELHQIVHKRLMGVLKHLGQQLRGGPQGGGGAGLWYPTKDISLESMVIGALEAAFWDTDQLIGEDKRRYRMQGGCTVLVAVFILRKLYVANAGDSRAVLCREKAAYPMSYDFTPVSERQRLQQLGYLKPHLLGNEYTHLDYCRRPLRKDLGKSMLYRDAHMTGWAYKEIQPEDLKFPIVYGEGKRSRLLATIGVTRGFGDHDLRAQSSTSQPVYIKPFLTPQPEVRVLDVEQEEITDADVLVMATDGLWDVLSNERVADIVHNGLTSTHLTTPPKNVNFSDDEFDQDEYDLKLKREAELKKKYRHITIAQDLVMAARGKLVDRNWKRTVKPTTAAAAAGPSASLNGAVEVLPATIDDISAFVIPILAYKREYLQWKSEKLARVQLSQGGPAAAATGGARRTKDSHATGEFDIKKFEEEMDRMQLAAAADNDDDNDNSGNKKVNGSMAGASVTVAGSGDASSSSNSNQSGVQVASRGVASNAAISGTTAAASAGVEEAIDAIAHQENEETSQSSGKHVASSEAAAESSVPTSESGMDADEAEH